VKSLAPLVQHYTSLADVFDSLYPPAPEVTKDVVDSISRECPHGGLIVEMGCGTAELLSGLRASDAGEVLALDVCLAMCRRARNRELPIIAADYSFLPIRTRSVKAALFKESVHHAQDCDLLRSELRRVLQRNGFIKVIIQVDWYVAGTDLLTEFVALARAKRQESRLLIQDCFGESFYISDRCEISTAVAIEREYLQLAVERSALSYWADADAAVRQRTLDRVQNSEDRDMRLHRTFHSYTLKERLV
jgi:hypothetical protein